MSEQKISLILSAVNNITKPIKQVMQSNESLIDSVRQTQSQLKGLGKNKTDIEHFRKLKLAANASGNALNEARKEAKKLGIQFAKKTKQAKLAREEAKKLGKSYKNIKGPSDKLTKSLEKAGREVKRLKEQHNQHNAKLSEVRQRLERAKLSTTDLNEATRRATLRTKKYNDVLEQQRNRLKRIDSIQKRLAKNRELFDKSMQRAANMSLVGTGAARVSGAVHRGVSALLEPLREVERAKGELATVGVKDLNTVIEKGREMQRVFADITAANFVLSAYDIKSGVSSLSDQGVADLTAAALTVAKATKADPQIMTSLFATSFGIFRRQFDDINDSQFGDLFGATLSSAVQQFKTDGGKMQRAIESAGAFAGNLGMDMREQLAVLGMLQSQMRASDSGTSLRSFAENAAKAHDAFQQFSDSGENDALVRVLDSKGQLRKMPAILGDLKARYGEVLDAFESAEIKKAFGTTEAVKLIMALWGQEKAVDANTDALTKAAAQGAKFSENMAQLANTNLDAKMVRVAQIINLAKQRIAIGLLPVIERLLPVIESVTMRIAGWAERNPKLTATLGAVAVTIGAIAAIMAPILLSMATVMGALAMLRFTTAKTGLSMLGLFNGTSKLGRALSWLGRGVMPILTTAVRGLFVALGPIGWIVGAIAFLIYKFWGPLKSFITGFFSGFAEAIRPTLEALKPLLSIFSFIGSVIGWILQKIGAAIGWFFKLILPVDMAAEHLAGFASVGKVVGKIIGTAFNAILAPIRIAAKAIGWLKKGWDSLFGDEETELTQKVQRVVEPVKGTLKAAAVGTAIATTPVIANEPISAANQQTVINNKPAYTLHIKASDGMDEKKLADSIRTALDERDQEQANEIRGQLYDS